MESVILDYVNPRELRDGSIEEAMEKLSGKALARSTASELRPVELSPQECDNLGAPQRKNSFLQDISDDSVDRHGDIVRQMGLKGDSYRANPVVLYNHNRNGAGEKTTEPPIALSTLVWSETNRGKSGDRELPARTRTVHSFHCETAKSEETCRLYRGGILRTNSIGFVPVRGGAKYLTDEKGEVTGVEFTEWELRENSVVIIPANPNASASLKYEDGEIIRNLGECPLFLEDIEGWLDVRKEHAWRPKFEEVRKGLRKVAPTVDTVGIEALKKEVADLRATVETLTAAQGSGQKSGEGSKKPIVWAVK